MWPEDTWFGKTTVLVGSTRFTWAIFILTDVDKVCIDYRKPTQRELDRLTIAEAQKHLDDGQFPPGSMGPKIQAAIEFLQAADTPSARVIICSIDNVTDALAGNAGTVITRG